MDAPADYCSYIAIEQRTPAARTGTWVRAWQGIEQARADGLRVRLAVTVSTDSEADEFRSFLDAWRITEDDRIIRRIALRGSATQGLAWRAKSPSRPKASIGTR